MDIKKISKSVVLAIVVLVLGTIIDYFAHATNPLFGVPSEYFRNKIIFGSIIGLLALWIFRSRRNMKIGALLYAAVITMESALFGIRMALPEGGVNIAVALAVRFFVLLVGALLFEEAIYWIAKHFRKSTEMAILFSAAIALGLQTKYFFLGFDLFFVFLFMFLHFFMFLLPATLLFRRYPEVFE